MKHNPLGVDKASVKRRVPVFSLLPIGKCNWKTVTGAFDGRTVCTWSDLFQFIGSVFPLISLVHRFTPMT